MIVQLPARGWRKPISEWAGCAMWLMHLLIDQSLFQTMFVLAVGDMFAIVAGGHRKLTVEGRQIDGTLPAGLSGSRLGSPPLGCFQQGFHPAHFSHRPCLLAWSVSDRISVSVGS
jgi:hypothetical protein